MRGNLALGDQRKPFHLVKFLLLMVPLIRIKYKGLLSQIQETGRMVPFYENSIYSGFHLPRCNCIYANLLVCKRKNINYAPKTLLNQITSWRNLNDHMLAIDCSKAIWEIPFALKIWGYFHPGYFQLVGLRSLLVEPNNVTSLSKNSTEDRWTDAITCPTVLVRWSLVRWSFLHKK